MNIPIDATAIGMTDKELVARELSKSEYSGLNNTEAAALMNTPITLATSYRLATEEDLWNQEAFLMESDSVMATPLSVITRIGGIDVTPGKSGEIMLSTINSEACIAVQNACKETFNGPIWLTWGWDINSIPINADIIAWARN